MQTCTDDEAGCVDYHEERIFSCNYFYQSYGPLFFSSNNILWHQLLIYFWTDFFLTCTHDQDGWVDDHKFFMPPQSGRHIELHSYVRLYVRPPVCPYVPQTLWHQLLLNYQADFFQTCIDDQAGCVDDRKERIFSCDHFYQSYGPLLISVMKSCGINSSFTIRQISFKLAQMIKQDV